MKSAPYLNPDPYCQFIGPKNLGEVLIDGELTTCLLDNRAQINFVTPAYAHQRDMDIMSLDHLAQEIGGQIPPIAGIGGIMVEPEGFVMMNVQVPCEKGYNEDQIAIVMEGPGLKDFQVILGTATIYRVMEVIKESEISELAIPWASSRLSWLMRDIHARMSQMVVNDVANKSVAQLSVDKVVRVSHKCKVPPFGHRVINGSVSLVLQGYRMNVMTHGLEKRLPLLPLGIDMQSTYAMLSTGSNRVAVVLRNNTRDWIEIRKGMPVARMVAANQVPWVIELFHVFKDVGTNDLDRQCVIAYQILAFTLFHCMECCGGHKKCSRTHGEAYLRMDLNDVDGLEQLAWAVYNGVFLPKDLSTLPECHDWKQKIAGTILHLIFWGKMAGEHCPLCTVASHNAEQATKAT